MTYPLEVLAQKAEWKCSCNRQHRKLEPRTVSLSNPEVKIAEVDAKTTSESEIPPETPPCGKYFVMETFL